MVVVKKDDIVTVVFINGAEVIGKLVVEEDMTITVNKPRMVQITEEGIAMVPGICMTGEEPKGNFQFNKNNILFIINTIEQLANQYQQMTSSIVIPKTGGIIK
tara:strand:+ start:695 stop:1003 length:309 start_codon:yes stop_codon:yes gene_type:complete